MPDPIITLMGMFLKCATVAIFLLCHFSQVSNMS